LKGVIHEQDHRLWNINAQGYAHFNF